MGVVDVADELWDVVPVTDVSPEEAEDSSVSGDGGLEDSAFESLLAGPTLSDEDNDQSVSFPTEDEHSAVFSNPDLSEFEAELSHDVNSIDDNSLETVLSNDESQQDEMGIFAVDHTAEEFIADSAYSGAFDGSSEQFPFLSGSSSRDGARSSSGVDGQTVPPVVEDTDSLEQFSFLTSGIVKGDDDIGISSSKKDIRVVDKPSDEMESAMAIPGFLTDSVVDRDEDEDENNGSDDSTEFMSDDDPQGRRLMK